MLREAAARHITVSEAEVHERFDELVRKNFSKPGSLQQYLAKAHETEADLLARIRIELLAAKIAAQVTAGKKGAQRTVALRRFEKHFQAHWKSLTNCKPGMVMEDCKQYKGPGENLTAPLPPPASASSGEVYSSPGAFSIASPEFGRNGPIPTEYTCAGAGVSPALEWEKVPAGTAELFLFVIDLNSHGTDGGQRWIVGGIDPSSIGVAAGKIPPGGIVGTNTAGKAAEGWLAERQRERGLKRSTVAGYEDMFERLYRDLGADTPVREFADGRLRAYFADFQSLRVVAQGRGETWRLVPLPQVAEPRASSSPAVSSLLAGALRRLIGS